MFDRIAHFANSLDEEGFTDDAEVLDEVLMVLAQANGSEDLVEDPISNVIPPMNTKTPPVAIVDKPVLNIPNQLPVDPEAPVQQTETIKPVEQKENLVQNPEFVVKNLVDATIQNMLKEGFDDNFIHSEEGKKRIIQEMNQSLSIAGS